MAHYKYERLSAQDNDFLLWEKPHLPMHGGSIQIFSIGPFATDDGGVDVATFKRGIEGILHKVPRYREKLAWIPGEDRAVWIDDPHFSIDYHIRHTALPRPGSEKQLKQLTARILERPLDRERPLWEIWVVEGLQNERFATIAKTHHCMVDGSGGVDMATKLFSLTPEVELPEPHRFVPRPSPTEAELRRDQWRRRVNAPLRAVEDLRHFAENYADPIDEVATRLRSLGQMAWWKIVPASETPLNGPVGPHRVLDWMKVQLDDLKTLRRALGCSINDIVLAVVTGAVRDFMIDRQVNPEALEFRVATPVNVRGEHESGAGGNRVSTWIVRLPLGIADPLEQVAEIHHTTQELKNSQQASALELVEAVHEWIPFDIQAMSAGTQNMYVTNVPGPPFPLYMMGAELEEIYVQPPLIENLGMVIAALSYNGTVYWGFNADPDRVPDLEDFIATARTSLDRLANAAGVRFGEAAPIEVEDRATRKQAKRSPPARKALQRKTAAKSRRKTRSRKRDTG